MRGAQDSSSDRKTVEEASWRPYRDVVTAEPEPGEEQVYGDATLVIVEWRWAKWRCWWPCWSRPLLRPRLLGTVRRARYSPSLLLAELTAIRDAGTFPHKSQTVIGFAQKVTFTLHACCRACCRIENQFAQELEAETARTPANIDGE